MPRIRFVVMEGEPRDVEIQPGFSLMEGAIWNDVPGIEAACGGACACGTCHVYVDPAWFGRLAPIEALERDMLAADPRSRPTSRLSCQLKVTPAFEGLVVEMPAEPA